MPRLAWIVALVLAVACGRGGGRSFAHRAVKGDVAIVGGTVVPMDREGTLPGHTVLIRGDRIVAVAPAATIDVRAATVIDAAQAWVLPGLADMHVHLWGQGDLALFLLQGVTTVRNLFGSPEHVRWRDAIARGELPGPTLLTAGPIFDGDPPTWPGSAVVTTPDAARAEVVAQKAAGYDVLKVYNGLSAEVYAAIVDEAKRVGLPVAGHVPKAVGLAGVLGSGQQTIEHLDGYVPFFGEVPAGSHVEATVKAGVWNCPTLVVTDRFGKLDDPAQLARTRGLELVSPVVREQWDPANDFRLRRFTPAMFESVRTKNQLRRALVLALSQAGGRLVLGTDTGNPYVVPGFAVADELGLLVEAGLTSWQALRTATAAAGELQGRPTELGVIVAGARADLIVVGRDPLADPRNVADPSVVVVRGAVHRRADLLAAASKPPPTAAERLAAMPALVAEGAPVVTARYDVLMGDQVIGVERATLSRLADGALVIHGQAAYAAPQPMQVQYRSTRDALDLTTDAIDPPRVVVTRKVASAIATQDGRPPVELAAAVDAVIAPQAIAELFWYAGALADLAVGGKRTLTAVEVRTEGKLQLDPGTFTFTRAADADGRRVYTSTGSIGTLAVTGRLTVDADGAPHEVALTVVFGTFTFRRAP